MVTMGKILEGAFGIFREHLSAVAIWGGIYLAGNIAILLAMQPMMGQMMSPEFAADPAAITRVMGPVYLLNFLLIIVGIVLYAAAMRSVLRPNAGGIAFLRLGMDELRLFALIIVFGIVALVIGTLFGLMLGVFVGGVAMASESVALTVVVTIVVGLAVFALWLFLTIRLSLAFPLTLHRERFVIGEAWRLSRGRFWTLFGSAFVVVIIGGFLSMAVGIFSMGSYFADLAGAFGNPGAANQVVERQAAMMSGFSTMMIFQSIGGGVVAAVWVTLSGGSAATATRLILAEEFDDAEEVFG